MIQDELELYETLLTKVESATASRASGSSG
jgi:hypothetical protein